MPELTDQEALKTVRDLINLEHLVKPFGPAISRVAGLISKAETAQKRFNDLEAKCAQKESRIEELTATEKTATARERAIQAGLDKKKDEAEAEKILIDRGLKEYREEVAREEEKLGALKTQKITEIAQLDRQIGEKTKVLQDIKEHGRKVFA